MKRSERNRALLPLALLSCLSASPSEWQNMNPGAGGRVIAITLDPNIDGRVFYLSDMEGVYRSENNGESWHYIGNDQRYSNSLFLGLKRLQ